MPADDFRWISRTSPPRFPRTAPHAHTHPFSTALSPTARALAHVLEDYGDGSPPDCPPVMPENWVCDQDLTPKQRRELQQYLTPRSVGGCSLWWDLSELPPFD